MRFGILGPLAVWASNGDLVPVQEAKVRALLADLLINLGEPVSPDRLVEDLWGASAPAGVRNALQSKVSQVRRVLDAAAPGGRGLLELTPAGYVLQVDPETLDATRFAALVQASRGSSDPPDRLALLSDALALWRGPALVAVRDEDFARATVARLEEERLAALEDQVEVRLALEEGSTLVGELADLVAKHPLRERFRAAHLLALYRAGRHQDALEGFQQVREHLADELGLDPGPALTQLHRAILSHDERLLARRDGSPTTARVERSDRGNLPAPLTSLIGRDREVLELGTELSSHRLVTLIGPGGVGKTRLGIEVARAEVGVSPTDGGAGQAAWFVDLSTIGVDGSPSRGVDKLVAPTAAEIADLVARVVGIRDDADGVVGATADHRGPMERLGNAFAGSPTLLVLDNAEHVIEAAASFVSGVLAHGPDLTVLVTSREPLGIPGEVVWPLGPLALPGAATTDRRAVATYSAVELFVARAAASMPGFELSDGSAAHVAEICRRLDGLPLALELAASHMASFGAGDLARHLDDRFRLLAGGKRGIPARQRTLRGVIDWSWDLLDEAERALLRRLAVTAGTFDLALAGAVGGWGEVAPADVVHLLSRLVDRSLVVAEPAESRFRLLESIAAYGAERLAEAGETAEVTRRFRAFHVDLAEQAEAELRGLGQRRWLEQLDATWPNLALAIESAIEDLDAGSAQRLANATTWYLHLRGRLRQAERTLQRVIAISDEPSPARAVTSAWQAGAILHLGGRRMQPSDQISAGLDVVEPRLAARARWWLASAEVAFGDLARSEALLDDALDAFRRSEDLWGIAAGLTVTATQALFRSDLSRMRAAAADSATLFQQVGDDAGWLRAIDLLSTHQEIVGEYDGAEELVERGLAVAEDLELWADQTVMLCRLGRLALFRADYGRADALHTQADRIARRYGHAAGEDTAQIGLALSARRQGLLDDADALLQRRLRWNRRLEVPYGVAVVLAELGFVAELRGDADEAERRHREGLDAALTTGDRRAVALALEGLAGAAAIGGDPAAAARRLGAAADARASVGAPLPPPERGDVDRITAAATVGLGDPERFAAHHTRGVELGLLGVLAELEVDPVAWTGPS